MMIPSRTLAAAVAFRFTALFVIAAALDGCARSSGTVAEPAPMGSITVAGPADSLFRAFRRHLERERYTIQRTDSARRVVRFLGPESPDEAVDVVFVPRGDSTTVSAQGVRGGMMATMTGIMAFYAMISPADSTTRRPHDLTMLGTDGRASEAAVEPPLHILKVCGGSTAATCLNGHSTTSR